MIVAHLKRTMWGVKEEETDGEGKEETEGEEGEDSASAIKL